MKLYMKSVKEDINFEECINLNREVCKKPVDKFTVGELLQLIQWNRDGSTWFRYDTVKECLKEYAKR